MYSRKIKMIEKGNLKLGEAGTRVKTIGRFQLDEIEEVL